MEFIYAITDIHGRLDLLNKAYDTIIEHADGNSARVVFLGDAIDRGPDSKGCIDRLIRGAEAPNFLEQINLLGNHEEYMIDVLNGNHSKKLTSWLNNGGIKTLESYGCKIPRITTEREFNEEFGNIEEIALKLNVPQDHKDWLMNLRYYYETDTHIFLHAGLIPGMSFEENLKNIRNLIWIRHPFLTEDYDFGKHIVHGHSPLGRTDRRHSPISRMDKIFAPPYRTNLDNGAVWSDILFVGLFPPGEGGHPRAILPIS